MKKALAVDDSRSLRDMLADCLTMAGHKGIMAGDGAEALTALREHQPDIVITDLNMPVMDGLSFIAAARAEEAGCDVPLLLVTTETASELKLRARGGRHRLADQAVRRRAAAQPDRPADLMRSRCRERSRGLHRHLLPGMR